MSKATRFLVVSIIGIAVAILVAMAEAWLGSTTGYHVYGFSLLVLIPIGSMVVGALAASGYYLACTKLQLRPGVAMYAQMVLVAAATNLLIYYFQYLILVWGDPIATDVGVFGAYLGEYFTHQEVALGRGRLSMGEVGQFGYWLAVLDFIGFLIGGAFVVLMLRAAPTCGDCNLYYGKRAKRNRFFFSVWEAKRYYDGLFAHPIDSVEFASQSSLGDLKIRMAGPGPVHIVTTLYCCPSCSGQAWRDTGKDWDGQNWRTNSSINRFIALPKGADLTELLKQVSTKPNNPAEPDLSASPRPS